MPKISLLTDRSIGLLIELRKLFPDMTQQKLIETALALYLHQQAEYQATPNDADANDATCN